MMRAVFPNLLTLGNLVCGLSGLIWLLKGFENGIFNPLCGFEACLFIFGAAVFDLLDGMAARLLKVSSDLGKQLDSLCDAVSFGVLPAFIIYAVMKNQPYFVMSDYKEIMEMIPMIIAIGAVYRLARFNIDTRQSVDFRGLPVPAQGIATASLGIVIFREKWMFETFSSFWFLALYAVGISLLMVSVLPLKSLKLKKGGIKAYTFHIVLIAAGLVLFIAAGFTGLFLSIIFYILWSLLYNFTALNKSE